MDNPVGDGVVPSRASGTGVARSQIPNLCFYPSRTNTRCSSVPTCVGIYREQRTTREPPQRGNEALLEFSRRRKGKYREDANVPIDTILIAFESLGDRPPKKPTLSFYPSRNGKRGAPRVFPTKEGKVSRGRLIPLFSFPKTPGKPFLRNHSQSGPKRYLLKYSFLLFLPWLIYFHKQPSFLQ